MDVEEPETPENMVKQLLLSCNVDRDWHGRVLLSSYVSSEITDPTITEAHRRRVARLKMIIRQNLDMGIRTIGSFLV